MKRCASTLLALTLPGLALQAESITYPPESGVFNVRDYGARGDGVADDTAAIQKAIAEGLYHHRVIYLPDGVYLVSDTLKWNNGKTDNGANGWGGFLQMQGQSEKGTVIKLKDRSPGFDNPDAPKAVIATGSSGLHGSKGYLTGEGNEAFENHLRNFTVDTGVGNSGAMGVDFQASNCGAMRHISIRGDGYCGLSLMRRDNGPGLIKDVTVEGFRFGIRAQQALCQFMFEDIHLKGQREAGVWIRDAVFGFRKLSSENSVPAMHVSGSAMIAIFDSTLTGTGDTKTRAALEISGSAPQVYVRGLATRGYAGGISRADQIIQAANIDEWSSHDALGPNGPASRALALPIRDTPEFYEQDFTKWAGPTTSCRPPITNPWCGAANPGSRPIKNSAPPPSRSKTETSPSACVPRGAPMAMRLATNSAPWPSSPPPPDVTRSPSPPARESGRATVASPCKSSNAPVTLSRACGRSRCPRIRTCRSRALKSSLPPATKSCSPPKSNTGTPA